MNWGYKIMTVYLLFVIGMLTLVYKCTQQNTELVADNYYDQEVNYQARYNKMKNANEAPVRFTSINKNAVELLFPEQFMNNSIKGQISFYRPDNMKKDFKMNVNVVNGKMQVVSDKLTGGKWQMTVSWSCNGKDYLQEEKLMMP
ncbi:MAG: FixH family protein [Bacteroidota bacterium]